MIHCYDKDFVLFDVSYLTILICCATEIWSPEYCIVAIIIIIVMIVIIVLS